MDAMGSGVEDTPRKTGDRKGLLFFSINRQRELQGATSQAQLQAG